MRKVVKTRRPASASRRITVFSSPGMRSRGRLVCGALTLACALGRSGVSHLKREGDGATPAGRLRLLSLYVRADRLIRPPTSLAVRVMGKRDGWCEAPRHGSYNRPIRLPSAAGHETMWRADHLYDIVGVLDWNFRPRASYRGSAIFLHLCRPGFAPTAGCIALKLHDLRRLLAAAGPRPEFCVSTSPRRLNANPLPLVVAREAGWMRGRLSPIAARPTSRVPSTTVVACPEASYRRRSSNGPQGRKNRRISNAT
jgi:L,D-peptidoglycan transpeptidase YkuD (ErfK/YbiS/YcfS/YnhG family)